PPVANRPRAPARPRDDKLQQEIDIFIKEVGQKKPLRQPTATAPAAPKPGPAAGPRPGAARRPAPAAAAQAPQPPTTPRRGKPGAEIASRQAPVSASLGNHVRQHLKDYMAEKVAHEVESHLKHDVGQHVAEHLGGATAAPQTAPAATVGPRFVDL